MCRPLEPDNAGQTNSTSLQTAKLVHMDIRAKGRQVGEKTRRRKVSRVCADDLGLGGSSETDETDRERARGLRNLHDEGFVKASPMPAPISAYA